MSSAGAMPIKTKPSTAAEIQAKQANVKDLKNIDIDSQHCIVEYLGRFLKNTNKST